MKKLIFSAFALVVFSFSTFAESNLENKIVASEEVKVESLVLPPSGSYTYTDSCGDEYEIEWYCSGPCTANQVVSALSVWQDANTCGAGDTSNWESHGW